MIGGAAKVQFKKTDSILDLTKHQKDATWGGQSKSRKTQTLPYGLKSTQLLQLHLAKSASLPSTAVSARVTSRPQETIEQLVKETAIDEEPTPGESKTTDDYAIDMNKILATLALADNETLNNLLSRQSPFSTTKEFDQYVEKFIQEIETSTSTENVKPLTPGRKRIYGTILSLCFVASASTVLGLVPLGAEATAKERVLGLTQFLLSLCFSHGAVYANAMHEVISHLDDQFTRYLQSWKDSGEGAASILTDIREKFQSLGLKRGMALKLGLSVAFYSPMQDAMNSRLGGIALVTGFAPSLTTLGQVVGNTMLILNWMAGFGLPAVLAASLFSGYGNDLAMLRDGASSERESVEALTRTIRKHIISEAITNIGSMSTEQLARLADAETTDNQFLLQLLNALGLENPEQWAKVDWQRITDAIDSLSADPGLAPILAKALNDMLDAPGLEKKVMATLGGETVTYSDTAVRTKALARLAFRVLINLASLNCLALAFSSNMVVNHYKLQMEDPTLDIDCHYFRNASNDTAPFNSNLLKLAIGSYGAQGFALSDAAIKAAEALLMPLGFILMGLSLENLDRAWQSIRRHSELLPTLCGGVCAATIGWVLNSANNSYQEYLELLSCDIGVPQTKLVEFKMAALIAQVLMVIILMHLGQSSFKGIIRKLSCSRDSRQYDPVPDTAAPAAAEQKDRKSTIHIDP